MIIQLKRFLKYLTKEFCFLINSLLQLNLFKFNGQLTKIFERIFTSFIKKRYFTFNFALGLRLFMFLCVNLISFYIFWLKFSLLYELLFGLFDYNFSIKFYGFFEKYSFYSKVLHYVYVNLNPIYFFFTYVFFAVVAYNFTRLDPIIFLRYNRLKFSINICDVFVVLIHLLFFFLIYFYFADLFCSWLSHVNEFYWKYNREFEISRFVPFTYGVYRYKTIQIISFIIGYTMFIAIFYLAVNYRFIYFKIKRLLCLIKSKLDSVFETNWFVNYFYNFIIIYFILKFMKFLFGLVLFMKISINLMDFIFLNDSISIIFLDKTNYEFYIIFFLIVCFLLTYSFLSFGFLSFWFTIVYILSESSLLAKAADCYTSFPVDSGILLNSFTPLQWLGVLFLIAAVLTAILVLLCFIVGPRKYSIEKIQPYECGFHSLGDARENFDVNFFLLAVLFLIFDLEIIFVMPLVSNFESLLAIEILTGGIFILLLFLGFIYEWSRNALNI